MMTRDWVSSARLRYLGTSAQKARLVVDLIRGKNVAEALTTLRFTRKAVADDIGRVLDAAIANASQKKQEVDVDRLYVHTVFVDGGPTLKRVRPAPMGRAFRVLKRMCHVTIGLGERPVHEPTRPRSTEADEAPLGAKGRKSTTVSRASARRKAAPGSKKASSQRSAAGKKDKKRS